MQAGRWKAVLFDLDGTLTNTLEDIAAAMNRALAMNGLPGWETNDYRWLVGNGARVLARRAVRERQELREKVLEDYQAYYGTHSQVRTRPYPGIPELLRRLTAEEIPVCVLSNKPHEDTRNVTARYFPEIPFAAVQGQTEGLPVKPDPTGALRIAERLGIPPERFAYLGDSAVDMTCALRAGMHPIGVLWGFREEEELREGGAEHLIARPEELLTLLTDGDQTGKNKGDEPA